MAIRRSRAASTPSRRTIEAWIRAGRVTVAGRTAQLGDQAAAEDDIRLDGRKLTLGADFSEEPYKVPPVWTPQYTELSAYNYEHCLG